MVCTEAFATRSPLYDLDCAISTFPRVPPALSCGSTATHHSTKIPRKYPEQQFPVSRVVCPAYTHYDIHQTGLKTLRRLCLGQINSVTGDVDWCLSLTSADRKNKRHFGAALRSAPPTSGHALPTA